MATFTTTLWSAGGNNVGIVVPPEVVESFARGKRVPVVVTVDGGYTYRTTTASMGGQVLVSFNAETRRATGHGAGDEVEVILEVDDAPRTVEVPAALATGLDDADHRPLAGAVTERPEGARPVDRVGEDRGDPRAPGREGAGCAAFLTLPDPTPPSVTPGRDTPACRA